MKETFKPSDIKLLCDRLVQLKDQGFIITSLVYIPDQIEVHYESKSLDEEL